MNHYRLDHVSDAVLLRELKALLGGEREKTASLLAHIAEVDVRRLYAPAGYSSMFTYCTGELRLSEDAAWRRIQAARAARRIPPLFSAIAEGRLHLTGACLIAPHLTIENANELIDAASRRGRAEIQAWLAVRFPQIVTSAPVLRIRPIATVAPRPTGTAGRIDFDSPAPAHVKSTTTVPGEGHTESGALGSERAIADGIGSASRRAVFGGDVSESRGAGGDVSEPRRPGALGDASGSLHHHPVEPAPAGSASPSSPHPTSYLVQVTIPKSTHDKLCHAQVLLSHAVAARNVAQVLDRALDALIEKLEKRKIGATSTPRTPRVPEREGSPPRDRYIPAHIRRFVWSRDGGRCTFVGTDGHRCEERKFLEFDHVEPLARGGASTREGLRLRCRAHNQYAADQAFGPAFMNRKRRRDHSAANGSGQGGGEARVATPKESPEEAGDLTGEGAGEGAGERAREGAGEGAGERAREGAGEGAGERARHEHRREDPHGAPEEVRSENSS